MRTDGRCQPSQQVASAGRDAARVACMDPDDAQGLDLEHSGRSFRVVEVGTVLEDIDVVVQGCSSRGQVVKGTGIQPSLLTRESSRIDMAKEQERGRWEIAHRGTSRRAGEKAARHVRGDTAQESGKGMVEDRRQAWEAVGVGAADGEHEATVEAESEAGEDEQDSPGEEAFPVMAAVVVGRSRDIRTGQGSGQGEAAAGGDAAALEVAAAAAAAWASEAP